MRRGFTLIELLTVMAITAILMTIIVVPMIQGFNFVRTAQAFADAQEKGRLVMERISREISNSAGVRDNSGDRGACDVILPGRALGTRETIRLLYTKVDIVKPAQDGEVGATGYINPVTGKIDPTLKAKKGQIVLPVAPGSTFVRYFIGLRDPFSTDGYVNPYDGLLMARTGAKDNLYVLYRAEVNPYVFSGGSLQPNSQLFEVAGGQPVLDDPTFFTYDGSDITVAGTKGNRIANWLKSATIVTEISRYDMVMPIYDKASREVTYDGNVPRILPLVQFRPTRVASEPAIGQEAVRQGAEAEGMDQFAPSVFITKFGGWSNTLIRAYPTGWATGEPYQVARAGGATNVSIFFYDPSVNPDELSSGVELFDVTRYENAVSSSNVADRYHFTLALNTAGLSSLTRRANFIPYFLDTHSGKIYPQFGIWEVGTDVSALNNNLPSKSAGPQISANTKTTLSGGIETYTTINEQFFKAWQDYPDLRPNIHRFIDLRVTPNADGTPSPLNPDPTIGFARATIVPGSDEVTGPDQLSGPNQGQIIRYYRTTGKPGPNQYRINYVDQTEPTDYTMLGFPSNPPATYDPTNFLSVVYQPRFKVGYVQLYSDPNTPLPSGNVTVRYRFQFTKQGDTIAVDYDSRQIMQVLLTMRNYPQTSAPNPQGITLKATATVRNYLR
jgi:prepilin-type N-terminal cleavage/methylation domain-containing protein